MMMGRKMELSRLLFKISRHMLFLTSVQTVFGFVALHQTNFLQFDDRARRVGTVDIGKNKETNGLAKAEEKIKVLEDGEEVDIDDI